MTPTKAIKLSKFTGLSGVALVAAFSGCSTATVSEPPAETSAIETMNLDHRKGELIISAKPGETVHIKQQSHEFWFGAAICSEAFNGDLSAEDTEKYKAAFLENFNSAVTENALKWRDMQPTADEIDYDVVDSILAWTDENGLPLRGHNIYWGVNMWLQPWVEQLSDVELYAALKTRGHDIGERYKGRFVQYDLNNEMTWKNHYADRLGEEITREMADWVLEKDPDAKLFLNDFDILTGRKLEIFIQHIKDLQNMGVAISGIGVQGHSHGDNFDPDVLKNALDELAQFDLPIIITEFNFPGQRSKFYKEKGIHQITAEEELYKAKSIQEYYRISFDHPAVDGILMWGFWAGVNWIPESSLYRKDWTATPALEAYQSLVYKEWWTDVSVEADSEGKAVIPAFYGDYSVRVGNEERQVNLRKSNGSASVSFR